MSAVNQDVTNNKDDDDVSVSQPSADEVLEFTDIDTRALDKVQNMIWTRKYSGACQTPDGMYHDAKRNPDSNKAHASAGSSQQETSDDDCDNHPMPELELIPCRSEDEVEIETQVIDFQECDDVVKTANADGPIPPAGAEGRRNAKRQRRNV